jgi:hypothetical protein
MSMDRHGGVISTGKHTDSFAGALEILPAKTFSSEAGRTWRKNSDFVS